MNSSLSLVVLKRSADLVHLLQLVKGQPCCEQFATHQVLGQTSAKMLVLAVERELIKMGTIKDGAALLDGQRVDFIVLRHRHHLADARQRKIFSRVFVQDARANRVEPRDPRLGDLVVVAVDQDDRQTGLS